MRGYAKFVALVSALVSFMAASVLPASADSLSDRYWEYAHTIYQGGSYASGDVVGAWQSILAADAKLPSRCYIDGVFGSQTKQSTISWQNTFIGSGAGDGVVGPQTWGKANSYMRYYGFADESDYDIYYYYGLEGRRVWMIFNAQITGQWAFRPYNLGYASSRANYWSTNHPSRTFPSTC